MGEEDLVPITVYVTKKDKKRLDEIARTNDRVLSVEARRAIRWYLQMLDTSEEVASNANSVSFYPGNSTFTATAGTANVYWSVSSAPPVMPPKHDEEPPDIEGAAV
jgi:hypothetical protein